MLRCVAEGIIPDTHTRPTTHFYSQYPHTRVGRFRLFVYFLSLEFLKLSQVYPLQDVPPANLL